MGRLILLLAALAMALAAPARAETPGFGAVARVMPGASLTARAAGAELRLPLSQGLPYRVFTLADPWRLVIDFAEVDWTGFNTSRLEAGGTVVAVRTGRIGAGWSRIVLELAHPMTVTSAGLAGAADGSALLTVVLAHSTAESFRAAAGAPAEARFRPPDPPEPVSGAKRRQDGSRPVVVVLDPGHGGVDPGAEHGGIVEAHLMLAFARELEELLLRHGNFDVILTRREDVFVPLEARVSIARAAGADVFLSLHADAVAEGVATGSTIYTLAETATDEASRQLAERHDRADLLAGVDLAGQDDVIAGVLMDLARIETRPRSDRLADALVVGIEGAVGRMHKRPRLEASFSVLKAPEIPSVLVELGFLSSAADRVRLTDPDWRARAAAGIRDGLVAWAAADAAEAALVRQ